MAYRWKCFSIVTSEESWDRHKQSCEGMNEGASLARIEDKYVKYSFDLSKSCNFYLFMSKPCNVE